MKSLRLSLVFLLAFATAAIAAGAAAAPDKVGEDTVVIVNPQTYAVTIFFSRNETDWRPRVFPANSTTATPYAKYVRIVTVKNGEELPVYKDDISPAGKYAIIEESSGRRVLRRPHDS